MCPLSSTNTRQSLYHPYINPYIVGIRTNPTGGGVLYWFQFTRGNCEYEWGSTFLVGEIGTFVPLLTSPASALLLPLGIPLMLAPACLTQILSLSSSLMREELNPSNLRNPPNAAIRFPAWMPHFWGPISGPPSNLRVRPKNPSLSPQPGFLALDLSVPFSITNKDM